MTLRTYHQDRAEILNGGGNRAACCYVGAPGWRGSGVEAVWGKREDGVGVALGRHLTLGYVPIKVSICVPVEQRG